VAGDARHPATYERLLGTARAQLLLTDPPYCLLTRRRKGGDLRDPKGRKIEREPAMRFESVRDYRRFTGEWLPLAVRCLTDDAPLVVWTNFLGKEPLVSAARELGYTHLWGEFAWAKRTKEAGGGEQLLRVYETALVLARRPALPLADGDPPTSWSVVAGYDDDGEALASGDHPHHKPFGVLEPLVRAYSRPGELILDPFGGSGSIAVAAARLGRGVATSELLPDWTARISERLAAEARRT
jgi:site-specific DNA-methyltransferase (adenine-specific)